MKKNQVFNELLTPEQKMRSQIRTLLKGQCPLDFNYINDSCFSFKLMTSQAAVRAVKTMKDNDFKTATRNGNYIFVSKLAF